MTDDDVVVRTDQGAVRVLTLNRPGARNAMNRSLIRALYAALKSADDDPSVHAVVLTGTDPAFCAGIDLKEAARDGLKYFDEFKSHSCITAVAEMRTPIVGAINGPTFTGGRMSMTGEVVDAVRAERIGLVTEVVTHDGLLPRALELAAQVAVVPRTTMSGLKAIYVRGASAVVDPALAAEDAIAGTQEHDLAGLEQRRLDVMRDNKSQIGTIGP
jgi:enoyl-CoA hydratase